MECSSQNPHHPHSPLPPQLQTLCKISIMPSIIFYYTHLWSWGVYQLQDSLQTDHRGFDSPCFEYLLRHLEWVGLVTTLWSVDSNGIPFSRRSSTTSACPFQAALWSGVSPNLFWTLTSTFGTDSNALAQSAFHNIHIRAPISSKPDKQACKKR